MADNSGCDLCARPLPDSPVEGADETFCCPGCRDVQTTLGAGVLTGRRAADDEQQQADAVSTYFRVDGMYSATCEAYLEAIATAREGVADAEASYVTETVRVDHEQGVSKDDLRDALTRTGYTAFLREAADDGETHDDSRGTTRRTREMRGLRKRRAEDMLGARYVLGIVFGVFLLAPYVAVLYPTYLALVFPRGPLAFLVDGFQETGVLFLQFYLVLTVVVLYVAGMPVLRGAYISLTMRRANTDLLVVLTVAAAFVYGTAAALLGRIDVYYDLAIVAVVTVMAVGFYESAVKRAALARLTDLTLSQVDNARRYEDDGTTNEVPAAAVQPGDKVLVREGERIPVDGVLENDECMVDEAVVTGESLPVWKQRGQEVVGGSIVVDGTAVVEADDEAESSVDRLAEAVWDIQSEDHGIQHRADRLAGAFAPAVIALAVLVGGVVAWRGATLTTALLASLTAVLVACPWMLGIATPLSAATNIREATERGVVARDGSAFERLREADVVVFDKTGTLTTGAMEVLEVDVPDDLLAAAATLERRVSHPVADAIVIASEGGDVPETDGGTSTVEKFHSHATGVEGIVDGSSVLVGRPELFGERGWTVPEAIRERIDDARGFGRLPVVVGSEGRAQGVIVVGDEPRAGWEEAIASTAAGDSDAVVLTGDDEAATEFFGDHPDVEHVFAGVPPEGKVEAVRRLRAVGNVAMVGDGTNDAPALAAADLGIALGSGTALAADAADVVIADDDVGSVGTAFALARAARRRTAQNTALACTYNVIAIPIALAGLLNPLFVTAAAGISGLFVAINASRSLIEE